MSNESTEEGQKTKWEPVKGESNISYSHYHGEWCVPLSVPASHPIRTEAGEVRADSLKSDQYGEIWCKIATESRPRWHKVQRNHFFTIKVR